MKMGSNSQNPVYDVVIVGGGICGALMASALSKVGKMVLVLEAGTTAAMNPAAYQAIVDAYYTVGFGRGAPNGPYPANADAPSPGASDGANFYVQQGPYSFMSDFLRMLGGSTLHWQGTSLRMVPNDFRMKSVYGHGADWPISYDDLEADYRGAESQIGVSADVQDQSNFGVWFPEGYVFPMHKMPQSMVDQFFARKLSGATVDLHGGTYPLRVVSIPVARNSTPNALFNSGKGYTPFSAIGNRDNGNRCQGNSNCLPICPVQAKYSALKTLKSASASGRVEIRAQCAASKLLLDSASGAVTAIEYKRYSNPSRTDFVTEQVKGRIVVLASNAIQNAVLLLASNAAGSSGQLGRNLMDHPYVGFFALSPEPVFPFRGPDTTSGVESLRDGKFREKHASFRASLANWGWSGEPATTVNHLLSQKCIGGEFRSKLRDKMTRMVKLGVMLEQLPDANNRVTLDASKVDALGNYLPVLTYSYDKYTLDGALAACDVVWPKVVERAGLEDHTLDLTPGGSQKVTYQGRVLNVMGSGHIVGTHRMGASSQDSVVDPHLRSWDHPNLFVVGAGSMVTIGTANPTLTAAALSLRAVRQILKELQ
jgi:choline dehydrogenase-like flavoprotein